MPKIIFDCDNTMGLFTKEVDDGLVLYYLLGRPEVELLGVTTTFGNGPLAKVHPQTVKMVSELNREEIPVVEGTAHRDQSPTPAARFLAETAAAHPGELIVLATGPLGNLRGAYQLDPEFYQNLKGIYCMGGYLRPIRLGRRNVAELNLSADPAASYQVLRGPCPVVLMNAQICMQAPFTWGDFRKLDFWSRKTRRSIREWLILHGIFCGIGNFYLWDLLPAVCISFPELFIHNQVMIESTPDDLESGTLLPREGSGAGSIDMPVMIKDLDQFKEVLFEAWRQIAI